jgi:hypothetical protein
MDDLFQKINKIPLPITILLGCIILGGFYYATETSKEASIERQHQADLQAQELQKEQDAQAKQDAQSAANAQARLVASEKADCVTQAQLAAVKQYNSSISCTGSYPSSDCFTGSYLVANYNTYYDTCLESKGLK